MEIEELERLSEKLRIIVEASNIFCDEKEIGVTISIGATIVNDDDDVEAIVSRADALMYESKKNGRNRVTMLSERERSLEATIK